MDKNVDKRVRSSLISDSARDNARAYQRQNLNTRRKMEDDFFQKSLDYRDFVFAPEGYEGIMLALYILTVPYLMGLLSLFLFVAEASFEYFLEFNLTSFFVIWAIGYEVCAVLLLAIIFLSWLKHINTRIDKENARKKPAKKTGF